MKKLLTFLLTLTIWSGVQAARHTVTSLPYTLPAHSASTWDTLFFGDQDTNTSFTLTWNPSATPTGQNGISFSGASYWVVLMANDTILFGGDSNAVQFRVFSVYGSSPNHIQIKGVSSAKRGYIINSCAAWTGNETYDSLTLPRDLTVRYNPFGIILGGRDNSVSNMYISVTGFAYGDGSDYLGMSCIWARYPAGQSEISNCELVNNGVAFYGRDVFPSSCIRIDNGGYPLTAGDTMTLYIHDNTMSTHGTQCIAGTQPGRVLIFDNTMTIDGRNAAEGYGTGEMWYWTHAFAVTMNRASPGTRIHGNTITSGSTYRGGQGIFVVSGGGAEPYMQVDDNVLNIHGGNSGYYDYYQNMGSAFKIRAHTKYIKVFDNHFTYTCDTTQWRATHNSGPAYMPIGAAIEYQLYSPYVAGDYHTYVYNNTCSTNVVTDMNTPYYMVAGIRFSGVEFPSEDTTLSWYGNTFKGKMNWAYTFGTNAGVDEGPGAYNYGVWNVRVRNDTIIQLPWSATVRAVDNSACRIVGGQSRNIVQDAVISGVTEGEPTYYGNSSSGMYGPQTGTNNLYHMRTVGVHVKGTDGLPISDAVVTMVNSYGQTTGTDTTGSDGNTSMLVSHAWYSVNVTDSTFNNFTVTATKGTNTINHGKTVSWSAAGGADTLTLPISSSADVVEYRTELTTDRRPRNLPGPKSQVIPLRLARQTVSFLQINADYPSADTLPQFIRVADGSVTERYGPFSFAQEPNAYYEAEFALVNGDTILYAANRSATYTNRAHIVRIKTDGALAFIDSQDVSTTVGGTYRPMGMPAYRGMGSRDPANTRGVVIPIRASSAGGSTNDIQMITSSNNGDSWSTMGLGFAWSTAGDKRVDGDEFIGGEIWFNGLTATVGTMRTAIYNGTTWAMDNVYPVHGYWSREYASVIQDDSIQHFLFSDTGVTANNSRIVHAYKKFGSGAWAYDTIYTAGSHIGQSTFPLPVGLTYTKSTNTVRAFYCKSNLILYSKKWTGTAWSSEELTVSQGTLTNNLTACNTVSSVHGDRAYVQYLEQFSGTYRHVLATVFGGGTIIPPEETTDKTKFISGTVTIIGDVRIP